MTVPVSKIDFHNFGKYYFYKLKKLRACLVIQMIAALLFYPLAAAGINMFMELDKIYQEMMNNRYASLDDEALRAVRQEMESRFQAMETVLIIGIVVVFAALVTIVIMHFIVPLISYRRLYKKTYADMDFSLPISADTGFWGDFLSGATVTVLPHLISILFGLICIQPLHAYDGSDFYGHVTDIVFNCAAPLAWTGFLGLIMLYCLTVLLIGCCGKMAHAAAVPILVNVSLPAAHWLLLWLGQNLAAGNFGIYSAEMQIGSLFVTSPLGMVISSVHQIYFVWNNISTYGINISNKYLPIQQARYIVPALILILLFVLAAWLVIRRRRAEQTGALAFAFKLAQYAVHGMAALTVCLAAAWQISHNISDLMSSMSSYFPSNYSYIDAYFVLLLIAVPLVYIILELAAGERKRFGRSMIRCAVTTVCSIGIAAAAMTCNAFGTFLRAPSAQNVSMVKVNLNRVAVNEDISFSLSERENIEAVADLQNAMSKELTYSNVFTVLDRMENAPESYENAVRAGFTYYTYDGRRKDCNIEISEETYRDILQKTVFPEVMANRCVSFGKDATEIIGTLADGGNTAGFAPLAKSGLTTEMVCEAIGKDCENVVFERMYKCESGNYSRKIYLRVLDYGENWDDELLAADGNQYPIDYRWGSVTVYPWFDNTLALLSEHGINVDFGVDTDKYKTAFIVKSIPNDERDFYRECYSGLRVSAEDLFGLAGNENYIYYAEKYMNYEGVDTVTGEKTKITGSGLIDKVRENFKYMRAAEIDFSQALELYPLCGSVYDVDTDYGSDHYLLVFVDVTGEELPETRSPKCEWYYIPAEHFDMVSGFFD